MHRKLRSAYRTRPSFLFMFKKCIHAMFFNKRQIFHHAHAVIFAIACIELFHAGTGIDGTVVTKAALGCLALFTHDDRAGPAVLWLGLIIAVTAFTAVFLTDMPDA